MNLSLPPHLQRIHNAEYPRFSAAEMERRRTATAQLMAEHGLDHLVYCGFNRTGSAGGFLQV
jgi:Xaa-Pro dipeptidase